MCISCQGSYSSYSTCDDAVCLIQTESSKTYCMQLSDGNKALLACHTPARHLQLHAVGEETQDLTDTSVLFPIIFILSFHIETWYHSIRVWHAQHCMYRQLWEQQTYSALYVTSYCRSTHDHDLACMQEFLSEALTPFLVCMAAPMQYRFGYAVV